MQTQKFQTFAQTEDYSVVIINTGTCYRMYIMQGHTIMGGDLIPYCVTITAEYAAIRFDGWRADH